MLSKKAKLRSESLTVVLLALLIIAGCELNKLPTSRTMPTATSIDGLVAANLGPKNAWSQLFGPDRNCYSSERGLHIQWDHRGPRELWRIPIGAGYSSPVVSAGHLIVCHRIDAEEIVQSFDALTGEVRWRFAYPTQFKCKYEYSNGPYSTPIVKDDFVYFIGSEAKLNCLRLNDGSSIWSRNLKVEFELEDQMFGFGNSPCIEGDQLIINVGASKQQAGIVAFDRFTGETRWTATDHRASYATPIAVTIYAERYLFVFTYDGLVALEPADGTVRWIEKFQSKSVDSVNATSPAVWRNYVVVMQGPGPGAKCWRILEDGRHETAWHDRRVLDSQFNSLLSYDGFLYGFTAKRQGGAAFRCVEFETGKARWSWNSDIERGSCLAADGRIILWGENGHLGALDHSTNEPLGWTMTDEPILEKPCYSSPALADGKLYLRNEHCLVAFDLRESTAGLITVSRYSTD